jgi:hypothetical protein
MMTYTPPTTNGYCLADDQQNAFSWHPTHQDAELRLDFEVRVMGRSLRIVKDTEAAWPGGRTWYA